MNVNYVQYFDIFKDDNIVGQKLGGFRYFRKRMWIQLCYRLVEWENCRQNI